MERSSAMPVGQPLIRFRQVRKSYGDLLARGDIEVEIVQHAKLAVGLALLAEADERGARRQGARPFHSASPVGG